MRENEQNWIHLIKEKKMLQKFLTIEVPLHIRSANNMYTVCTKPYEMSDFLTRLNKDSIIEIQYTWLTVFLIICDMFVIHESPE